MLATLADELPRGGGWLYEVKFDGYRAIAYVRGGECGLRSRNGNDLTGRFASVARAVVKALKTPNAVLDGEVCALDDEGRPSFSAHAERRRARSSTTPSTCSRPTASRWSRCRSVERRERLRALLDRRSADGRFSEAFDDGEALLEAVDGAGARGRDGEARRTRPTARAAARGTGSR